MAKKYIALKKQIQEIQGIKDITDILEKVAAADVHYLENINKTMRQYGFLLGSIFSDLTQDSIEHPFLKYQSSGGKLNVILTAEKSLCGGLFDNLIEYFSNYYQGKGDIMVIGRVGQRLLQERSLTGNYFFPARDEIPREKNIRYIRNLILNWYLKGKYKEIIIYYPEFINLNIQKPNSLIFLPFTKVQFSNYLKSNFSSDMITGSFANQNNYQAKGFPIYEPSLNTLLDYLMNQYGGIFFYQKILETKLSELAARTVAMGEAGEKAKDLISKTNHQYFKTKRAAVTKAIGDLYDHRFKKQTIYEQINQ